MRLTSYVSKITAYLKGQQCYRFLYLAQQHGVSCPLRSEAFGGKVKGFLCFAPPNQLQQALLQKPKTEFPAPIVADRSGKASARRVSTGVVVEGLALTC